MGEPIRSAEEFTAALHDVANRYMAHLEPSANAQLYAVQLTMTGERLNIAFNKSPNQSPYIAFTLQSEHDEATPDERRGLFGGR